MTTPAKAILPAPTAPSALSISEVAVELANILASSDVLFAATDEQSGIAIKRPRRRRA